ncbi:MAG: hypothetical protein LCH99_15605 [Proteobacteria bacterium]|nr:hypothetical protein [Pseudomonadota bacterium]
MTNNFDFGYMPVRGGFIAFYRMVHHSENFILRDGKLDILFNTAGEAYEAAGEAFKAYMNSPISGMTAPSTGAWDEANATFNLEPTSRPSVIRQHRKTRPVEVERKAARA